DMEIGGADQTFNMLCGRDLSKSYLGKEKFVRTNKMMDAPDGITMSKTKGNGINLADSSEDMFGKAMSYPDDHIISGLELLTEVPMEEIKKIEKELKVGANPMELKKFMAFEIVKMIKGEPVAEAAREHFVKTVQKKETPDEVDVVSTPVGTPVGTLIAEAGLAESNAGAKRKIKQGGVEIGGEKITDANAKIAKEMDGQILKVGKRGFRIIQVR
ncbi:MAG: tyrosine--tRNA ligase, partial [Candidatus Pacebacteria bacterium]|nr:tyrosine--tRNA ligase [Candidatus Paceibacterota bacterium]